MSAPAATAQREIGVKKTNELRWRRRERERKGAMPPPTTTISSAFLFPDATADASIANVFDQEKSHEGGHRFWAADMFCLGLPLSLSICPFLCILADDDHRRDRRPSDLLSETAAERERERERES